MIPVEEVSVTLPEHLLSDNETGAAVTDETGGGLGATVMTTPPDELEAKDAVKPVL